MGMGCLVTRYVVIWLNGSVMGVGWVVWGVVVCCYGVGIFVNIGHMNKRYRVGGWWGRWVWVKDVLLCRWGRAGRRLAMIRKELISLFLE